MSTLTPNPLIYNSVLCMIYAHCITLRLEIREGMYVLTTKI